MGFAVRLGILALAVAVAVGLGACGGEDAAPLTLEQRLPTPAEVPGYKPEPGDPKVFSDSAEFANSIQDALVQATVKQATDVFEEAGFVSAIGQDFSKEGVEGASLSAVVIEFGSADGAQKVSDWRDADIRKPCPEKCIVDISEFDVEGISGATKGVHRAVTTEALEATGEEGQPFDSYEVGFMDGPIAYDIVTFGPPGSVTQTETIAALKRLSERVKDAPLPEE
jgi:hypothetical protein